MSIRRVSSVRTKLVLKLFRVRISYQKTDERFATGDLSLSDVVNNYLEENNLALFDAKEFSITVIESSATMQREEHRIIVMAMPLPETNNEEAEEEAVNSRHRATEQQAVQDTLNKFGALLVNEGLADHVTINDDSGFSEDLAIRGRAAIPRDTR